MIKSVKDNIRLLIIVFISSLFIGLLIENYIKKNINFVSTITPYKVEFFIEPKLYVFLSTFDKYDSQVDILLSRIFASTFQSSDSLVSGILSIANSDSGLSNEPSSLLLTKDFITNILYKNYSKRDLVVNDSEFVYNKKQILKGDFTFYSRGGIEESIELVNILNTKIKEISLITFKIRKNIFSNKEEQAKSYVLNRLKDLSNLNESSLNYLTTKNKIIEAAYEKKIKRIENALEYSLLKNIKKPIVGSANLSNLDNLYVIGSEALEAMLFDLKNNKDLYFSNPEFASQYVGQDFLDSIEILEIFNKFNNDAFIDDFLVFYSNVENFTKNNDFIEHKITKFETQFIDRFKNLKMSGTITIIFTSLSLLLSLSFLSITKKD